MIISKLAKELMLAIYGRFCIYMGQQGVNWASNHDRVNVFFLRDRDVQGFRERL